MKLGKPLEYSFWYDLFFHVIAHLPLKQGDAGSLYELLYVRWVDSHFPDHDAGERTLVKDAGTIASMYNQTPRAFQLYTFLLLYDHFETFAQDIETPFEELVFPDEQRSRIASNLKNIIPPGLTELLRIALWSEANCGYIQLHRDHIVPLYKRKIPDLETDISQMTSLVRGFNDARMLVSHPLRRFGRSFQVKNRSAIFVGLPCPGLDVPPWAPVFQACHEYILGKVLERFGNARLHDTRGGEEGFFYHMSPEITALSIQARLYGQAKIDTYSQWLSRWLPGNCAETARFLPWEIKNIPRQNGTPALVDWLASGQAVPGVLESVYRSVRQWFEDKK